jgi:hypothetical protein
VKSLHGITNSIAVTSQVVVPICDDDIVGLEEFRYVLVEGAGGLLAEILSLCACAKPKRCARATATVILPVVGDGTYITAHT